MMLIYFFFKYQLILILLRQTDKAHLARLHYEMQTKVDHLSEQVTKHAKIEEALNQLQRENATIINGNAELANRIREYERERERASSERSAQEQEMARLRDTLIKLNDAHKALKEKAYAL